MKRGRKTTIGTDILAKAQTYRTVAELSREIGASPGTVRDVLRRASNRGDIAIRRFIKGKSGQAMHVEFGLLPASVDKGEKKPCRDGDEPRPSEIEKLFLPWSGK